MLFINANENDCQSFLVRAPTKSRLTFHGRYGMDFCGGVVHHTEVLHGQQIFSRAQ